MVAESEKRTEVCDKLFGYDARVRMLATPL